MLTLEQLEATLREIQLPFQPQVLSAVLQLRDDTRMDFGELDRLIRTDQNIASLILKVANSSFYSRGHEIRTLPQAIGMIGFRTIVSLVSAVATKKIFMSGNYARFRRYVWQHSLVVSVIGKIIAEKLKLGDTAEEVFISGLLHDIGKVVLNQMDREKFIRVLDATLPTQNPFRTAEVEIFGVDHESVGQLIIKIWKLPSIFREVAVFLDKPQSPSLAKISEKDKRTIFIVGLANVLAKLNGFGHLEAGHAELHEELCFLLDISPIHEIRKIEWVKVIEVDPYYQAFSLIT